MEIYYCVLYCRHLPDAPKLHIKSKVTGGTLGRIIYGLRSDSPSDQGGVLPAASTDSGNSRTAISAFGVGRGDLVSKRKFGMNIRVVVCSSLVSLFSLRRRRLLLGGQRGKRLAKADLSPNKLSFYGEPPSRRPKEHGGASRQTGKQIVSFPKWRHCDPPPIAALRGRRHRHNDWRKWAVFGDGANGIVGA
ncbi:hypothetical protein PCH_Pc12g07230 [Penicillium rubens Wisconsin 54-1255]|uniref:Uncharacterized protein n=1 Tax=Penicillium rubens (strain ATCC 28089 / DSM 1075 / NRRL 1951 / Wisconsin 54-1255) TaxID=500485 RepID=B6GWR6_PENRW|nr:hypothetical protein PCH_Pc12g07230 [Penicillium rubens Wisconsin 54-1255]